MATRQGIFAVIFAFMSLALTPMPRTRAADARGSFWAFGSGTISCGRWRADRGEDLGHIHQAWLLGFLSAFNAYAYRGVDVAKGIDSDGLFAWVDEYCAAHPLDALNKGAAALAAELASRQLHSSGK